MSILIIQKLFPARQITSKLHVLETYAEKMWIDFHGFFFGSLTGKRKTRMKGISPHDYKKLYQIESNQLNQINSIKSIQSNSLLSKKNLSD